MSLSGRIEEMIKCIEEVFDLEKGERRYVDPSKKKWKSEVKSEPSREHDISSHQLGFHTAKVKYAPAGSTENPHDHPTHSEHVIIHGNKPIGYATVHHAHPRDNNKVKDAGHGTTYEHQVDIHAPSVHPSAHPLIRAKMREHLKSPAFKEIVNEHNKEHYNYDPKKGFSSGGKGVKAKYKWQG